MTNYELMFIIDPTLEDEKKEATVETVKGIIEADGTVGEVDVWGLRKLAYPIQKKNEGYYVVVEFKAGKELPKELVTVYRQLELTPKSMDEILLRLPDGYNQVTLSAALMRLCVEGYAKQVSAGRFVLS